MAPHDAGLLPISRVVADTSVLHLGQDSLCRITRLPLQEGAELVCWSSRFAQPTRIALQDDSDHIHFSFNSQMQGKAACHFDGAKGGQTYAVEAGAGSISYGPGRRGSYYQQGRLDNVTVMVRPEVLHGWVQNRDAGLADGLGNACYLQGHRGAELHSAAHQLIQGLGPGATPPRHGLWLRSQALLLVSLFLEGLGRSRMALPATTQRRLAQVHEQLLADLSRPPSLDELARDSGLSVPTLVRAFRRHYGRSVYDLFQHARMHHAQRQLADGKLSVLHVAADLGYSNASHFAAAFRKQFGVNPSAFKTGRGR